MAYNFNKFNQFSEDVMKGVHNFTSDATCKVTVALCNAANAPTASDSVLADLTTINHTNLSSRVVTGISAVQVSGVCTLSASTLVITALGPVPTFRYVVLYNDDPTSPEDPLIGYYDLGADINMAASDTLTLDFSSGILTAIIS
jgi:hypothetical protein